MRCCALVFLAAIPSWADVVPISSSAQTSAAGSLTLCNFTIPGCTPVSHNSFTTNPGFASVSDGVRSLSAGGSSQLAEADVTPTGISLQLFSSVFLNGLGNRLEANVSAHGSYSLVFDLTNESIMHVSGAVDSSFSPGVGLGGY